MRTHRVIAYATAPGFEAEYFKMASPPDLIPSGDWKVVEGSIVAPKGFRGTGMYAGMRSAAKGDVALVVCDEGAVAAGTFTQNVVCAAPVTVCKDVLSRNSGAIKAVRCSCLVWTPTHVPSSTLNYAAWCTAPRLACCCGKMPAVLLDPLQLCARCILVALCSCSLSLQKHANASEVKAHAHPFNHPGNEKMFCRCWSTQGRLTPPRAGKACKTR